MSHSGADLKTGGGGSRAGRRRAERRGPSRGSRLLRTLVLILVLAVLAFGFVKVKNFVAGPADYTGQGKGKVVVEVPQGANGQQIADVLASKDVVKSAEAFYQVSLDDARAQSIQPGFYQLRKQMSAKAALAALVDKRNRVEGKVVVPEGSRVGPIVQAIARGSEITAKQVTAVLDQPKELGLPAEAKDNPEGYLFPATYTVEPGTSARTLLRQMVAKTLDVEKRLDIDARARSLNLSKEQVLTVASILEYEANRAADYPKVARVLYNRLKKNIALQLDSTVSYVSKRKGDVWTTPEERASTSEYNTYKHTGLPPGPIGSPGEKTIEAALNPAAGDWLYFVPDFEKGTTVFSDNLADHEKAAKKAREYCRTHDEC
jgi:peptidoglycan lytic transglycosylase G